MSVIESIFKLFEPFVNIIIAHPILASLLGGLFAGEEFTLFLAFLSSRGYYPIWIVYVFSFIGVFIMDFLFYQFGRSRFVHKFFRFKFFEKAYSFINLFVQKITYKHKFLILLYTKFIFGTRLISLIYLGIEKTSYRTFLITDFFVTLLWTGVIVTFGYFIGKGYSILYNIFKSVQISMVFIFIMLLLFFMFRRWIRKKLIQDQNP